MAHIIIFPVISIKNVAWNIATTADSGEEVGIIEAKSAFAIKDSVNIKILIFGIKILIILQIVQHPLIGGFDGFLVGDGGGTDIVE